MEAMKVENLQCTAASAVSTEAKPSGYPCPPSKRERYLLQHSITVLPVPVQRILEKNRQAAL